MKNELTTFNYNDNQIRTEAIEGNPWFCLSDCCDALNLARGYRSAARLNEKGVRKTYTLTKGGNQELTFINEPNLYRLIFRSNKPQAQAFADWVYSEVLPAIRKTGSYTVPVQGELGLVPVREYTRRLPSAPREIKLSEKARSEIGGIVKSCVGAAIRDAFQAFVIEPPKPSKSTQQSEIERNLNMAILAYGASCERKGMIQGILKGAMSDDIVNLLKQATPRQVAAR